MTRPEWMPLWPGTMPPLQEKVALFEINGNVYSIGILQIRHFTGVNRLYLEDLQRVIDVQNEITQSPHPVYSHWALLPAHAKPDDYLGKGTKAEDWL